MEWLKLSKLSKAQGKRNFLFTSTINRIYTGLYSVAKSVNKMCFQKVKLLSLVWTVRFNGHCFGNSEGVSACDVIVAHNGLETLYLHASHVTEILFIRTPHIPVVRMPEN